MKRPPAPACALLLALGAVIVLAACGPDPEAAGTSPERPSADQPPPLPALPAPLVAQLDAWCEKVALFAEARGEELPVAEDMARELVAGLPVLRDALLAAGEREAALPHIELRLTAEGARSGDDGKAFLRASQLLALYAAVEGGKTLEVYRGLLWEPKADFRLRWQAAQAMAAADVDATAIEFAALIQADASVAVESPEQMLTVLEQAGYQDLPGFYIMVLRKSPADRLRNQAAYLARNLRDPRLLPVLRDIAENDRHGYARINAAQSIAKLVGTPALPYLRRVTAQYEAAVARGGAEARFTEGFQYAITDADRVGIGPLAAHWKD